MTDVTPSSLPSGAGPDAPTFTADPKDTRAVRVTAADFNGQDWDSSPFSVAPAPDWLLSAIKVQAIRPVTPGSTDYAEFEVDTAGGCYLAIPGDWLALNHSGHLIVLREATGPLHTPRKPMEAC